ncbi:11408_t:CDS:2, partial [Paraglomus brasilianum]
KSTRTWRAMEQLHKYGYVCVYITLHDLTLHDEETFWRSFGQAFTCSLNGYFGRNGTMFQSKILIPDITSVEILQNVIAKSNDLWSEVRNFCAEQAQQVPENPLIIFVDEFDSVSISNTICMSFLNKVHGIKTNDIYAVQSIIGIGTFNILQLSSSNHHYSPFNISDTFINPKFTKKDVKCLFQQFHEDNSDIGYHVADRAIETIYRNSNGHPGLVNLCGRAIENWLRKWHCNCGKTNMTFAEWLFYSAINLQNEIPTYTTFDEMLKNLHKKEGAMNLLRTYFLGSLDSVVITNDHEREIAGFLVGLGVLEIVGNDTIPNTFKISSPYIDMIIRRRSLPEFDKNFPTLPPPKNSANILTIVETLKHALKFFNQAIICQAPDRSFKMAKVPVGDVRNTAVPRESTYDMELNRVLPVVILELLATGTDKELDEHFTQSLEYSKSFSEAGAAGVEVWVINFTRADDTLSNPHWQSNEQAADGLNVMHIWHDRNFKTIKMCNSNRPNTFETLKL